jgi:two-component system, NarL family, sensor histidine kinase UhpB
MSLFWRVFAINAVVIVAAVVLLAVTPARVSAAVTAGEVVVLALGAAAVLAVQFLLLRRALRSLSDLTALTRRVDPRTPGERLPAGAGGLAEVTEVTGAFNAMLDRLEAERRESSRRAVAAQERERRRLSLELHDEVGQTLTAVVLQLDGAERLEGEALRSRLQEAQETAREGAESVREITRGLRPEVLEDLGLRAAIVTLASTFAERAQVHVTREVDDQLPALAPEHELVVYRVVQEALTNVARHARAREVWVGARGRGDGGLEAWVRDDGCGMPAGAAGSGLDGMRERALLAGGTLAVGPVDGGTEVRLRVPA